MDTSLFVNYINPYFVIGLLTGVAAMTVLRWAENYAKKEEEKELDKNYNDTKKIFD